MPDQAGSAKKNMFMFPFRIPRAGNRYNWSPQFVRSFRFPRQEKPRTLDRRAYRVIQAARPICQRLKIYLYLLIGIIDRQSESSIMSSHTGLQDEVQSDGRHHEPAHDRDAKGIQNQVLRRRHAYTEISLQREICLWQVKMQDHRSRLGCESHRHL